MSIIRREKTDNYTVICNQCLRDEKITARAKGIFAYLMTLPDDWKVYKTELYKHFKEGRDALTTAFAELEEAGYVEKVLLRDKDGTIIGNDYIVKESSSALKNRRTVNPSNGESASTKYLSKPSTERRESSGGEAEAKQENKATANSSYSTEFLEFWSSYPNKKSKAGAWKSWKREKPPLSDALRSLEMQKADPQWVKDNGQFIPHPQTWINNRRWEDEQDFIPFTQTEINHRGEPLCNGLNRAQFIEKWGRIS